MAKVISSARNVASVRRPTERTLWKSADEAIPTTSSEPTSGMTVIRMTLTHSVPRGSMSDTIPGSGAVESLNIAASAAVLFAEHYRQHLAS